MKVPIILTLLFSSISVLSQRSVLQLYEMLGQEITDSHKLYQILYEVNGQQTNGFSKNRNLETYTLDSCIQYFVGDNFHEKTEFIRDKDNEIHNYFKRTVGTEEWIFDGCSEYGINEFGLISYVYFAGCAAITPFRTNEFFYNDENKLERYETWQAATNISGEINNSIQVSYNNEGQLSETTGYRLLNNSFHIAQKREFKYNELGQLDYILGYEYEEELADTIGIKVDSLKLNYSSDGLLKLKSFYGLTVSETEDLERWEYIYNNISLELDQATYYQRYSTNDWNNIEINTFFYDSDNSLMEHYIKPTIEDGVVLSNTQMLDKTKLVLYGHNLDIPFNETIFQYNHRTALPFVFEEPYKMIDMRNHKSMLTSIAGFTREGAIREWDVDYYYSPITVSTIEIPTEPNLEISPNPTSSFVIISHLNQEISKVQVLDLTGKIISVFQDGNLDLTGLDQGTYLAVVWVEGFGRSINKIVKVSGL